MAAPAVAAAPSTRRERPFGLALWLAWVAALAGLAELLLLRITTRTAIHIPGIDRVAVVYRAVADTGRLAYYLAVVLLAAALVAAAAELSRRGHRLAPVAVGSVLAVAVAGRLGILETVTVNAVVTLAVVGLAAGVAAPLPRSRRLPVLLYAAAFTLTALPASSGGLPGMAGEVAAAAAMVLLAGLALRRADRIALGVGAAVALVGLAALLASPSTARILLLWNAGLSGALPAVVYAVGAGAVVATVVGLWRAGKVGAAVGLALIVEAGFGLHSTYQSALAVLGLAILTLDPVDQGRTALLPGPSEVASSR
jgi:hypothetical protein